MGGIKSTLIHCRIQFFVNSMLYMKTYQLFYLEKASYITFLCNNLWNTSNFWVNIAFQEHWILHPFLSLYFKSMSSLALVHQPMSLPVQLFWGPWSMSKKEDRNQRISSWPVEILRIMGALRCFHSHFPLYGPFV